VIPIDTSHLFRSISVGILLIDWPVSFPLGGRYIRNGHPRTNLKERRNSTMTEPNNPTHTDNQKEQTLNFLRDEIASLKSRLTKKDDRITSLDVMLNTVMESHNAEVRAYENLEGKLEDVIEMLRNRIPHSDILDYLKVKDRNSL
jgi:hypothetical protein